MKAMIDVIPKEMGYESSSWALDASPMFFIDVKEKCEDGQMSICVHSATTDRSEDQMFKCLVYSRDSIDNPRSVTILDCGNCERRVERRDFVKDEKYVYQ